MSKTIKELADELGVSKQAISYHLKKLEKEFERQNLVVKENGILSVTKMAEKLIISAFSENKDRQKENEFLAVQKTTLNELKKQLKEKENYIQKQEERISMLESQLMKKDLVIDDLSKKITESQNIIFNNQNLIRMEQNNYYQIQDKLEKLVTILQEKNEKKGFEFWKK